MEQERAACQQIRELVEGTLFRRDHFHMRKCYSPCVVIGCDQHCPICAILTKMMDEEREACAKVAELLFRVGGIGPDIAAAIRARGEE
jgi:hypothetical protein